MVVMAERAPEFATIAPLQERDVEFAVALHQEALPEGFFVSLGAPFLRAYYETFRDSPHAIALVATIAGAPRGIVVGTVDDRGHYRWVLRHRLRHHARPAVRGLLEHPALAARFLRTRGRRYLRGALRLRARRSDSHRASAGTPTSGVLTHLAVDASARHCGLGSELVHAFVQQAQERGGRRLRVATRAASGVGRFYEQLGWQPAGRMRNLDGDEFELLTLEQ